MLRIFMLLQEMSGVRFFLLIAILFKSSDSHINTEVRRPYVRVGMLNGTYYVLDEKKSINFTDIERLFKEKNIQGDHVKSLEIKDTQIKHIVIEKLGKLRNLEQLEIIRNKYLKSIGANAFKENKKLSNLKLDDNAIKDISLDALNGVFQIPSTLGTLDLSNNLLQSLPVFRGQFPGLITLNINDNPIKHILPDQFANMISLGLLYFRRTDIRRIDGKTFKSNFAMHYLTLGDNKKLEYIADDAFVGTSLHGLDLSGTSITKLPTQGLENLNKLNIGKTPNLHEIPDGIIGIATLRNVTVSEGQQYLCCAFEMKRATLRNTLRAIYRKKQSKDKSQLCATGTPGTTREITKDTTDAAIDDLNTGFDFDRSKRSRRNLGFQTRQNRTGNQGGGMDDFSPDLAGVKRVTGGVKPSNDTVLCNNLTGAIHQDGDIPVTCTPRPDALRPCDDIMGNVILTCFTWLVAIVGLLGNAFVFAIISLSQRPFTVTKFLLQNLSFADLCLALYLFLLVSASSYTTGNYYNYVQKWQYGGGCGIAGFLAIFSSQLSMLVLMIITVERYFAIVYAMHFNFRLSFYRAKILMIVSWILAFILAILPLMGVNSYNDVALCLPFRTSSKGGLTYIGILLFFNVILFSCVLISYVRMYLVVRSPHLDGGGDRADSEVAKRMALLVFTDFFCWAPIAIVSCISAFGDNDLIGMDVKKAKYLLVIFFPINSLFNPFLYATTTSTFKRDVYDVILRCGCCYDHVGKVNESLYSKNENANFKSHWDTNASVVIHRVSTSKSSLPKSILERYRSLSASPLLCEHNANNSLKLFAKRLRESESSNKKGKDTVNLEMSTVTPKQKLSLNAFNKSWSSKKAVLNMEKSPLVRCRSNSDSLIISSIRKTRFSDYDLTPEALRKAKETTGL